MNEAVRITSRDNQHLKFARRVRDRKEPGHIFIEGKRLCREALASGVSIEQIFCSDKLAGAEFERIRIDSSIPSFIVGDGLIASIADTDSPQGIVMIARRPESKTIEELFGNWQRASLPLWVCLERPNNPSNLGAVLRTAEAADVRGVFVTSDSADAFAPKALRASMGSAFRLPIASVSDPEVLFRTAKRVGVTIAAMDSTGECSYLGFDWTKPTLLILGAEASGLSSEAARTADHIIRIEMKKPVESLNLAVSAGVVLFEAVRQNRLSDG